MKSFRLLYAGLILTLGIEASAFVESKVTAASGHVCNVFLDIPSEKPLALYVRRYGSGLYSMNEADEKQSAFLKSNNAAGLYVDRPGITADASAPKGAKIDEKVYYEATHEDMIDCTIKAIDWALKEEKLSETKRLIFHGHSEGVEVLTRVYLRLLKTDEKTASKVELLLFTGTPLSGLSGSFDTQLSGDKRALVNKALEESDDAYLVKETGLPATYLNNWKSFRPLREDFDELAVLHAPAQIEFFHGLLDTNCACEEVRKYEKKNDARKNKLRLGVRYYSADHGLNDTASDDVKRLFRETFARP